MLENRKNINARALKLFEDFLNSKGDRGILDREEEAIGSAGLDFRSFSRAGY